MDHLKLTFSAENINELIEILKVNPASVILTELNGNIVYVNKTFEKRSGYSFEEIKGKNPRFLKSDETDPDKHKKLWETISNGDEWSGEFRNKRKNGELFWEYSTIYPIKDSTEKIKYFLAIKEDISQIKLLEETLLKMEGEKIDQKGFKFQFLKQISNEIAVPIHSSIDFIQLLKLKCAADVCGKCITSQTYLEIINHQAEKVLKTTGLLKNISEIKSEAAEVKLNLYNRIFLNNLVKEIKEPVTAILGILSLLKSGCTLKFDLEIDTGYRLIYNSCIRVVTIVDIFCECSQNEKNDIKFYKNVLFRISEEKEKLEKRSFESVSPQPEINSIIKNYFTVSNVEDPEEKVESEKYNSEMKINIGSEFFVFKRNEDLLIETKLFNDITIVFLNTNRATLSTAKVFKDFMINIVLSGQKKVIVDLSKCNNLDSAFAGVLFIIKKALKEVFGSISLVFDAKHIYLGSFAMLNLELQFEIFSDIKSAILSRN